MKAHYLSLGLTVLAMMAAGCDNIDENDRYTKAEKPEIDNPRNLLIMEFTGNTCLNCPTGASIVERIKESNPEGRVISVGLHPYGSPFTNPVQSIHAPGGMQDFRTQAATALYDYYKPSGFPAAVFNGTTMSGTTSDWIQKAREALTSMTYMNLSAECIYDTETRELNVDYAVEFLDYFNTRLNATVWLVENKIMGRQTMPNNHQDMNYEHNHVLRASLNGDWGESLGDSFLDGETKTGQASITLNENWKAENCHVVVYVYRDDNKGVEQTISLPIMGTTEPEL